MQTIAEHEEMTAWSVKEKRKGATIGLVPTMGYLHAGHVSLMRVMRPLVDRVVVSSYVNPLQFGVDEDLDRYPSDPVGDAEKCRAAGVDCLFVPSDIYPDGFRTAVMVHELTDGLCGASRPGHFEGVTTVVSRLFGLTRCDVAIFGEKDFQQLAVIRRMVRDLAMPVQVIGAPLIRADDGVALSSRNAYLSDHQRSMARTLSSALFAMAREASGGEQDVPTLIAIGKGVLTVDELEYLEIVDPETLMPLKRVERAARALVAARVGKTRLIDNLSLG